jgi:CheY-like chemotaxis protein
MARVLIVDDSEDLQDALRDLLTCEGFEVASALNGERGLNLVRERRPDVILLDMMMPEVDGLEFLSRLSAFRSPPPVVGLSGFEGFRDEALHRGAVAFLLKPISDKILIRVLRSALEQHAVDPTLVAENVAGVEPVRRIARQESGRAVARLARLDTAEVREGLRRVASWLPTYLGFGTSVVGVLRGDQITVEVVENGAPSCQEGTQVPLEAAFCGDVITVGSTLVLPDAEHHPCEYFAHHKEMKAGWRFYAGVPLTTSGGAVMGSLCVRDTIAREFRSEDMRVLEALGRATARGLESNEWPLQKDGAFAPTFRELFVEVMLARAAREGGAGVVVTIDSSARAPAAKGLAAVRVDGERVSLLWGGRAASIPGAVCGTLRVVPEETATPDRVRSGALAAHVVT